MVAHDLDNKERTEDVAIEEGVTFDTMLLPDYLLQGLKSGGFKKPSPIQLAAIPLARCGLDLIVQAKSGTGKTLVFAITALESINLNIKRAQVIIIAPTREIAFQIGDVLKCVGSSMKGLKIGTFVGGRPTNSDKPDIKGCHIAVGSPGRMRHLIELNILDPKAVRLLVLDEADKLFETQYDYQHDLNYIFNNCGESKQVLALSATYPPELLEFTGKYMRDGKHVTPTGGPAPVLLGLRQMVLISKDHPDQIARTAIKEKELVKILETVPFDQCCVFLNYATRAESINCLLQKKGFASTCLTGKQDMNTRIEAMASLKSGGCRVLVTTDLVARGIDASCINLVINCDLPWDPATYLHRMGRAGRYGSHGICISIISDGIELEKFRKMLGQIGGKSMAVNVIPKLRKFDLWTDDLSDFDKVLGMVETNEEEESLDEKKKDFKTAREIMNENPKESIYLYEPDDVETRDGDKTKSVETISLKDLEDELNNYLVKAKPVTPNKPQKPKTQTPRKSVPKKVPTYSEIVTNSRSKKSPNQPGPSKINCKLLSRIPTSSAPHKVSSATDELKESLCHKKNIVNSNSLTDVSKMLEGDEKNGSVRSSSLEMRKFLDSKEKSENAISPNKMGGNSSKAIVNGSEVKTDDREQVDGTPSNKRKRNQTAESGLSADDFDTHTYTVDSNNEYETLEDVASGGDLNSESESASGIDLNSNPDDCELSEISSSDDSDSSEVDYPSEIFRCMEVDDYKEPQPYYPPTDWFMVLSQQIHDYVVYARRFYVFNQ